MTEDIKFVSTTANISNSESISNTLIKKDIILQDKSMKKEKHFKIFKLMKLQVILLKFQNKFQIPKLIKIKANIYK